MKETERVAVKKKFSIHNKIPQNNDWFHAKMLLRIKSNSVRSLLQSDAKCAAPVGIIHRPDLPLMPIDNLFGD